MTFLSENDAIHSNNLIPDKEFRQFLNLLFPIFCYSRMPENRNSPDRILEVQELLWQFILHIENSYKKGKDSGRMNTVGHKRLLRIARTICDGVVWRNMGYKRAWLGVLSHNKRNMLNEDYPKLLVVAKTDFQWKICFIWDLTETLRIWDLIVVDWNKTPLLIEAKNGLWETLKLHSIENHDERKLPSRQMHKILDTQKILSSWRVERQCSDIVDSDFLNNHHFEAVLRWIQKAHSIWVEVVRFDKNTSVMILDAMSPAFKYKRDFTASVNRARRIIKWNKDDIILRTRSFDSFWFVWNHFLHSIAPYSIFPFPDDVCMWLMTGDLQIYSYYNISWIMREFEKNGWQVERIEGNPNDEVPASVKDQSGLFWEPTIDGTLLKISRNGYFQKIPIAIFYELGFEFLSYKSIIWWCEQTYQEALKSSYRWGRWMITNFTCDKDLFL
jgi:hypothetical protein